MEHRERTEDFRAPPSPEELSERVRQLDELAEAAPEQFAIELRAF